MARQANNIFGRTGVHLLVPLAGTFALIAAVGYGGQAPPALSDRPDRAEMSRLVKEAAAVKTRHMDSLFRLPAVVGAGIGLSKDAPRKPVIEVYLSRALEDEQRRKFPKALDGVPVVLVETGPIRALSTESKEKPASRSSARSPEKPKKK